MPPYNTNDKNSSRNKKQQTTNKTASNKRHKTRKSIPKIIPNNSQKGSKKGPKREPKGCQKGVQKGPKMTPKTSFHSKSLFWSPKRLCDDFGSLFGTPFWVWIQLFGGVFFDENRDAIREGFSCLFDLLLGGFWDPKQRKRRGSGNMGNPCFT